MSRKNVLEHELRDSAKVSADLSLSASFISEITNVKYLDNIGLQVSWAGTSPVGQLYVDISSDNVNIDTEIVNWTELDFGSPATVSGNTGSGLININQVPFTWMRVRYTRSSGTGTMNINISAKMVG